MTSTQTRRTLTAQYVSRLLREAGARPTPRGEVGYTVSGSSASSARRTGTVTVSADWDLDTTSQRRATQAADLLRENGLTVEANADGTILYVTREG